MEMDKQRQADIEWIKNKKRARFGQGKSYWSNDLLLHLERIEFIGVFDVSSKKGDFFIRNIERIFNEYSPDNYPRRKRDGGTKKEISDYSALKSAKSGVLKRNTNVKCYPELIDIADRTEWKGFFSENWHSILEKINFFFGKND
jgi:hypothetical protein